MSFIIYGQRYHAHEPLLDQKGVQFDDGSPRQLVLGRFEREETANLFADNVKRNTRPRSWRIWIETAPLQPSL